MPLLLDGNNLLHRLPAEQRSRDGLRSLVLDLARRESVRVVLVFDGAAPDGTPARERLGAVTVEYAAPRTADQYIIDRLPAAPAARQWTVFTDDRGLASRARNAGARTRPSDAFLARLNPEPVVRPREGLAPDEIAEWEAYFRSGREGD